MNETVTAFLKVSHNFGSNWDVFFFIRQIRNNVARAG